MGIEIISSAPNITNEQHDSAYRDLLSEPAPSGVNNQGNPLDKK